ncbi:hypothetical protein C8Q76DRAFT_630050 [Earliella scabrosa]|nr:hypothetical protein C8Q76DRAFT_630050 [Earliella scabrosa]
MPADVKETLNKWRMQSLRVSDLPYSEAVMSLSGRHPMIEAKKTGPREWTMCKVGTNETAVFFFAAVFEDSDDYYTGNLVLDDNEIPPGIAEDKVEKYAGYKCNYSYAFNTLNDPDLYAYQSALDTYMKTVPGFNTAELERRTWQSGNSGYSNAVFWMSVPMFVRAEFGKRKPAAPEYLHPWVVQAARRSRRYRPNPARPAVRALDEGRLRDIRQCFPEVLYPGDVVAIRFTVTYTETEKDWHPGFLLTDVVRVCHGPMSTQAIGDASHEVVSAPVALDEGEIVDGECEQK